MSEDIPVTIAEPTVDTSEISNIPEKYRSRTVINSKYIFEKKIGSGSFGSVYRGRNIDLENTKKVFIKAFETENQEETLATAV